MAFGRSIILSSVLAALALLGPDAAGGPASAEPVLERVVLVQRHGVRAPTQSPETLAQWSARGWPQWPVPRGHLTDQGAQVVALIADGVRNHYVRTALLPAQGCPGAGLMVWADGKDERTRRSGQEMATHLAPGCALEARSGPHGSRDPLFDSAGGSCTLDPQEGAAALRAALGPGGDLVDPASARAIGPLFAILRPGAPVPLPENGFAVQPEKIVLIGPLAIAAAAGEIFLLEYAQGLPPAQVAWGAASDPAQLLPLLAPRNRLSDLVRSLPYVAVRQGAGMARLMLATLAGEPHAAAPVVGADVKLLALAGHDDNLSNMAGVFGVDWSLPGQPDATAPATVFALERWRDPATGAVTVALRLFYAELEGMRRLDPASVKTLPVALPGCEGGTCPLERLRARVLAALPPACGQ